MPEINGKTFTLRETLTGKDWWALAPVMASFGGLDDDSTPKELLRRLEWDDLCTLVGVMVDSWELDGEPGDPAVMDALGPGLYELSTPCLQRLLALTAPSGEAESAST